MRRFALIGYPLGHSFSQRYFTEKFEKEAIEECKYVKCALENIDILPKMLSNNPELCGFNVTIPYKEQVIRFLDSIDNEAQEIGAVNCVRISDGVLRGYNTDVYGFRNSLLELIGPWRGEALVLGSGGASKAVVYVLDGLGIKHTIVSRTKGEGRLTYDQVDTSVLERCKLLVNTTPLGTFPNIDASPDIDYGLLGTDHFLFDVVYNPPVSQFLTRGLACGAKVMNGHKMLIDQAEKSWEIWNSRL